MIIAIIILTVICLFFVFLSMSHYNTYIKEHAEELADRTVVIADLQSDGKGRIGNIWLATRDMLPVSVLLKHPCCAQNLTVICAVAVCRSIERLCKG